MPRPHEISRLRTLWEKLRSSLWFLPAVLVLGAMILAVLLIEGESFVAREQLAKQWPRIFGAGAEGARGMLSAIASSMITVAGVAFSITIVTFALASSQYTSRILRNFMRDRGNQAVLGVFLGVFAYCLVVLRTIRGGDEGVFVPSLAVVAAVLLALIAIGFLVFFIHHIADSIQASSIIQSVASETIRAVDRLYPPSPHGAAASGESGPSRGSEQNWAAIPAGLTGYLQAIDHDSLLAVARERKAVLRVEKGVGEFVIENTPLASLARAPVDDDLIQRVNSAFIAGRHRTLHQDAGYGIRQIVDIALKALSPSINDTTTAITCIDYLGAVLVRLADRPVAPPTEGDQWRVIRRDPTVPEFVSQAFDQIRQNAGANPAVLASLLEALALIVPQTGSPDRLSALREQAEAVVEAAGRCIPSARDRQEIQAAWDRFSLALHQETPR